jgi:hypothetical protein
VYDLSSVGAGSYDDTYYSSEYGYGTLDEIEAARLRDEASGMMDREMGKWKGRLALVERNWAAVE